jgi:cell division protein FtsB
MIYLIIILLILLSISIYANINSLKTIDVLEKEIEVFSDEFIRIRAIVIDMRNELKAIDRRGSFEADDEVGIFFKNLKTIVMRLDELFKK